MYNADIDRFYDLCTIHYTRIYMPIQIVRTLSTIIVFALLIVIILFAAFDTIDENVTFLIS